MHSPDAITIPLILPFDSADAFARFLKRCTYTDCVARSNRIRKYPDGRDETDVMWSAVCLVQRQLADAGFNPR
jgi:hypothetical protein